MSELSFFSTLRDVIATSDTQLRDSIGSLSPHIVTDYVFYLREELAKVSSENERLRRVVENQQGSFNGRMASLEIEEVPAIAPPGYDVAFNLPNLDAASLSPSSQQFNSSPSTSQLIAPPTAVASRSASPSAPSVFASRSAPSPAPPSVFASRSAPASAPPSVFASRTASSPAPPSVFASRSAPPSVPSISPSTSLAASSPAPSPAPFPHIPGSVWTLDQDGSKPNGIVEFLPNGTVRWSNGETHGHWKLRNERRLLEADFIGIFHEFEYFDENKEAVLKAPIGTPVCRMWLHGTRDESLSNELGCSAERVYIVSCSGTYIKADPSGTITTSSDLSEYCVFDVVQVQSCSMAFRSKLGQYILVRPEGIVELKKGGFPNVREFFVPKRSGNKTAFLSYFDRYLSIGADGSVNAKSENVGSRELFEVRDVSGMEFTETACESGPDAVDHADAILGEVFIQSYHGFYVSANVTCQESDCGTFEKVVVRKIAPNVVVFQSCFGKYLSAQPNGSLLWNKDSAQLSEQFTVDRYNDKFVFRSHHGRYITASRSGRLEANAEGLGDYQELFTVTRVQDVTARNPSSVVQRPTTDPFPGNMPGSTWTWSHDGVKHDGTVTFLLDGGTKWNNGPRGGHWELREEGSRLVFQTPDLEGPQEMVYIARENRAFVISRSLLSPQMWIQDDTGESRYRSFSTSSSSIALKGHKNTYITANQDTNIDCSSEELTANTVFKVVQIKPDTVALRSPIRGFLSVDLAGAAHPLLTWYTGDTPGLQQYFKVGRISNDKITLQSFYGHYISALNNGEVVTRKKKAKSCETFHVEDGSHPVVVSAVRRVSDTDYAALLSARAQVCLRGHHGCFVSANATCSETTIGTMELIMIVRVDHNVVAVRNCFGKFLSALPNGVLTWNRDAIKTSEQFTVEKVEDKFLFRSSHGKYMSALPGGRLEASRVGSGNCEYFTVVDRVMRQNL